MIGQHAYERVLFTRKDLDQISERCTTYIMQRSIDPVDSWKQAIEDQAGLIQHKLELMEEGALEWDWQGRQLAAMERGITETHRDFEIRNMFLEEEQREQWIGVGR